MEFDYNEYIKRTRRAESGGNDKAKNPKSSASGRYQFIKSTWEGLGFNWSDRFDVNKQEQAMQKFTQQNVNTLNKQLGREVSYGDAYGAHVFGTQGYIDLVKSKPNAPISSVFPDSVIKANASFMRGRTVGEVIEYINKKAGHKSNSSDKEDQPATDVYEPKQHSVEPQQATTDTLPYIDVRTEADKAKDDIKYVQATEDLAKQQYVQQTPESVISQPEYNYLQDTNLFTIQ